MTYSCCLPLRAWRARRRSRRRWQSVRQPRADTRQAKIGLRGRRGRGLWRACNQSSFIPFLIAGMIVLARAASASPSEKTTHAAPDGFTCRFRRSVRRGDHAHDRVAVTAPSKSAPASRSVARSGLKCHRGVARYRQTCSYAFTGACGSAPRRDRQAGDESECD